MQAAIKVLNDMVKKKVIAKYALGGAMALAFYIEPALTYDLDVFVFLFPSHESSLLVSLQPIYDYCLKKKYTAKQEHLLIEGIAVQFIPAYNKLVEEAVSKARKKMLGRVPARVLLLEYLVAIMLQTNRPKDHARLTQVMIEGRLDKRSLQGILKNHGLTHAWQKFTKKNQL